MLINLRNALMARKRMYMPVEWIDTGPITSATLDAGAVIDTGIKIDSQCEIESVILPYTGIGNVTTYGVYFGSSDSLNPNDVNCVVFGMAGNTINRAYVLFLSNDARAFNITLNSGAFRNIKLTYDSLTVDGVSYGYYPAEPRYVQSNYNLMLGCRNSAGNHWRCSRARYKSFSIKKAGKYLCQLSSVVRISDGAFGMYDQVSKSFLVSINSHSLIGPDVASDAPAMTGGGISAYA